jgi:hypothetical protein
VQKITAHMTTLDQLDEQLKAEQEKAKKEAESKADTSGKEVTPPKGVKSRTVYSGKKDEKPAETKAETKAEETKPEKKGKGSAADALAKLKKTAAEEAKPAALPDPGTAPLPMEGNPVATETPATTAEPASEPAETSDEPDLAKLAAQLEASEVEL